MSLSIEERLAALEAHACRCDTCINDRKYAEQERRFAVARDISAMSVPDALAALAAVKETELRDVVQTIGHRAVELAVAADPALRRRVLAVADQHVRDHVEVALDDQRGLVTRWIELRPAPLIAGAMTRVLADKSIEVTAAMAERMLAAGLHVTEGEDSKGNANGRRYWPRPAMRQCMRLPRAGYAYVLEIDTELRDAIDRGEVTARELTPDENRGIEYEARTSRRDLSAMIAQRGNRELSRLANMNQQMPGERAWDALASAHHRAFAAQEAP